MKLTENDGIIVITDRSSKPHKITLEVGKRYVVQPLNSQKKKHRDRRCVLLDFVPVSDSHARDIVAKVRFIDNNRIGRTELDDLVPRR